jgi:hypothetical protein
MPKVTVLSLKELGKYTFKEPFNLISISDSQEDLDYVRGMFSLEHSLFILDEDNVSIKDYAPYIREFVAKLVKEDPDTHLVVQCRLGAFRSKGIATYAADKLGVKDFRHRPLLNPVYDILMRV